MSRFPWSHLEANPDPTPTDPDQVGEAFRTLAATTRRAFLGGGLAAAGVAAGSSTASGASTSKALPSYVSGSTARYFQQIQANEASHVQIDLAAIRLLGGTPRPYPTFRNIDTSDPQTLLRMAVMFENTGTSAGFGVAPYIFHPEVKNVATSLTLVEAYQSGFLNSLANQPLVPGGLTYAVPATIDQVVAAVQPFIVSLNDNGAFPATFSTTPSPENDVAILNFILLLDYLEATFYFNSVPKVFGRSG